MEIRVLVEDTSNFPAFQSEHGFSIYIDANHHKILFDTGASDLFLKNAEKLNVNIRDVDLSVISHGHYDHGGGLKAFLEENDSAKVYMNRNAFAGHYSMRGDQAVYIGLDKDLQNNDRIILTDGISQISHDLLLFDRVSGSELLSSCNSSLYAEKTNSIVPDNFDHEQNLILTEDGKTILIAGCAHRGIVNILNSAAALAGRMPDYVIGGFHLYNHSKGISEDPSTVAQIGEFLKGTNAVFYTGHCTGTESFHTLKKILGDQIHYLSTGSVVRI